ncbi:hypothetical protein L2E82_35073 [Cichorium intybus]|uniref:Uncharacterized protein n=1 Tax=Cichorium intybus TaxID=13427 RepID=A0ACB9BN75_CICIN|nr:hypothetical protein L2E82_35073 [Cichorium intybus]
MLGMDKSFSPHNKSVEVCSSENTSRESCEQEQERSASFKQSLEAEIQENQESGKAKKQKKSAKLVKGVPHSMKMKDIVRGNFQKKPKKGEGEKARSSSNGSINSTSIDVMKNIEVGQDVGFQLDGFDQILRKEIEGEGVNKCQR